MPRKFRAFCSGSLILPAAAALLAAFAATPARAGHFQYVTLDIPGQTECFAAMLNDRGQVIGDCWDSAERRGFVWENGSAQLFGQPQATFFEPTAVNAKGLIAATYIDSKHHSRGAIYNSASGT